METLNLVWYYVEIDTGQWYSSCMIVIGHASIVYDAVYERLMSEYDDIVDLQLAVDPLPTNIEQRIIQYFEEKPQNKLSC